MNLKTPRSADDRYLLLYFQVHQPYRLRSLPFLDIGSGFPFFDDDLNGKIMRQVSASCYLPTNKLLLKLIRQYPQLKITFSVSGTTIDQMEQYSPEVLKSFKQLASTGSVEFLSETNYHSLACMIPGDEFEIQVLEHVEKIHSHFGLRPAVFRNTELIYNNEIGRRVSRLGFNGVFLDGVDSLLEGKSANKLYVHPQDGGLKLFLRNYRLSDDIAFRFTHNGRRLTATEYISRLNAIREPLTNLAMDYETFGEHFKQETGILSFLENFLTELAKTKKYKMLLPSEAVRRLPADTTLSVPHYISWADQERDLSAWLGNDLQRDAYDTLCKLEHDVKGLNDPGLLKMWRYLQTSDHFYYMAIKNDDDGKVHSYFSPYPSPYEAFINYMNVLTDFNLQVSVCKSSITLQEQNQDDDFLELASVADY